MDLCWVIHVPVNAFEITRLDEIDSLMITHIGNGNFIPTLYDLKNLSILKILYPKGF